MVSKPTEIREISAGDRVIVRTADNRELPRIATSRVVDGADFPVVWVCEEHDYDPHGDDWTNFALPWPEEDVWLR